MTNMLYIASRQGKPDAGYWSPVGRLDFCDGIYRFVYTQGAKSLTGFKPFPKMLDLDEVYESEELFPLFSNRVLSKKRPEYKKYLRWSGFDPKKPPDTLTLLAVTNGIRQTDSFEVFPRPEPDEKGRYHITFFLHGVRWMHESAKERILTLKHGDRLRALLEIDNPADSKAVQLQTTEKSERLPVGYVPRYLASDIRELCKRSASVRVAVTQVNAEAPMQQRVLCEVESCWPDDFQPCSDKVFQPIASVPEISSTA